MDEAGDVVKRRVGEVSSWETPRAPFEVCTPLPQLCWGRYIGRSRLLGYATRATSGRQIRAVHAGSMVAVAICSHSRDAAQNRVCHRLYRHTVIGPHTDGSQHMLHNPWGRIHPNNVRALVITRKCLNAPCGQVEVECVARVPSTSGRQGAGEPYWATLAGQPLRFTVGDSRVSFPPGDCAHPGSASQHSWHSRWRVTGRPLAGGCTFGRGPRAVWGWMKPCVRGRV